MEKPQEQINELWDYQVDAGRLEFTEKKAVELEDLSRRNNLHIDGITEKKKWNLGWMRARSSITH